MLKIIILLSLFISLTQSSELSNQEMYCNNLVYGIDYGKNFDKDTWAYAYGKNEVWSYIDGYSSALHEHGLLSKRLSEMKPNVKAYLICEDALDTLRKSIKNGKKPNLAHEWFFMNFIHSTRIILKEE